MQVASEETPTDVLGLVEKAAPSNASDDDDDNNDDDDDDDDHSHTRAVAQSLHSRTSFGDDAQSSLTDTAHGDTGTSVQLSSSSSAASSSSSAAAAAAASSTTTSSAAATPSLTAELSDFRPEGLLAENLAKLESKALHHLQRGEVAECNEYFETALELSQDTPTEHKRLLASQVKVLYEASCFEDALLASLRHVHLPRPGAEAFAWLGRVHSALGDHPQAFKAYRLAVLLAPHVPEHLQLLSECLQTLRVRQVVSVTVGANGDLLETENLTHLVPASRAHSTPSAASTSAGGTSSSSSSSLSSSSSSDAPPAASVSASVSTASSSMMIPSASTVRNTAPSVVDLPKAGSGSALSTSDDSADSAESLATTYAFSVPLFSDQRGALLLGHARGREHDLLSQVLGTTAIFAMRSEHEGPVSKRTVAQTIDLLKLLTSFGLETHHVTDFFATAWIGSKQSALVQKAYHGGTLRDFLDGPAYGLRFTVQWERMIQQYFFQICVALRFLHSNCIVHSSLDTSAVMLGSCGMSVYLGGFDRTDSFPSLVQDRRLGKFAVGECPSPKCGAPPEVVLEQHVRLPISSRDMWSAGMILVDMYSPTSYWQTNDENYTRELRTAIAQGSIALLDELESLQPDLLQCKHWSRALNLVKYMMRIRPEDRVTSWQVFHHPFFEEILDSSPDYAYLARFPNIVFEETRNTKSDLRRWLNRLTSPDFEKKLDDLMLSVLRTDPNYTTFVEEVVHLPLPRAHARCLEITRQLHPRMIRACLAEMARGTLKASVPLLSRDARDSVSAPAEVWQLLVGEHFCLFLDQLQSSGAELLGVRVEAGRLWIEQHQTRVIHSLGELPVDVNQSFISSSHRFVITRTSSHTLVVNGQQVQLFPILFSPVDEDGEEPTSSVSSSADATVNSSAGATANSPADAIVTSSASSAESTVAQ
eukprot:CAMPEP_0177645454 /NCGR_PEP_ID=MMETSP0447-20121125/9255_1 /TAXON_ID=0 /ORGANISM="Stygamoeba regulata, Strain BSH-02190019" /LENGTH=931 /DNA_ID=CAMNT_0019147933 /DNA_START=97 /DNA_END=2892 /DNA_ORIENTATION=+